MTLYYVLHKNTTNIQETVSIYQHPNLQPSVPELYPTVK